ncbi:MAG: chemotaxis response regulator protein-glutamate methylesterase [Gammaproteobacteria bacterium]|nr:chemotaxis response regulator protein-glutamate methylesterase [Gammaproteobacteria bacterium]PCH63692.1 MAG: chemotaxis response regulator protein-glutamate methylesterase [Gammaproteobacteria bacterium]
MNSTAPIRVLVVDDSALIRQLLTKILSEDPAIEVVGTANDPYIARDKIKLLKPDVITLDVEMPRMDGITFLQNLMRLHPIPTVMVSSLTTKGADVTMRALELGVIDFVTKPNTDVARVLETFSEEIIAKVKVAASVSRETLLRKAEHAKKIVPGDMKTSASTAAATHFKTTDKLIAIGASTGGTEAIKEVLMQLPYDSPGVVISQHIPSLFSTAFAARMNEASPLTVCEAQDGQQILNGHAYIAPGGRHLKIERNGARFVCKLDDGPLVNRHKPSVDVMFNSIVDNVGVNAVGVILTGMGHDGAEGLMKMHDLGISTIAQDEKTSIVWGMPGSAVKLGAIDTILPLGRIAGKIISLVR